MSKEKMVPKIRFKGFEGEWEKFNLGENSNIIAGGTPSTNNTDYWFPKEIPWMSSGEVHKKRIHGTNDLISSMGLINSSARWVEKNSVLIALAGQGKTRGTVATNEIPLTTNQSIAAIQPNDSLYYEHLLYNLEKRYEELRLISAGDGSRGGLNKKQISNVNLYAPKVIKEQKMIGEFIRTLDCDIKLREIEVNKLQNFKKAMLQKMFPKEGERAPEIRFEEFEGEWESTNFKSVINVINLNDYISTASKSGKFPVIQQGANPIVGYCDTQTYDFFDDIVLFGDHTLSLFKPQSRFAVSTDGVKGIRIPGVNQDFLYVLLEKYIPKSEGYKRYLSILKGVDIRLPNNKQEVSFIGEYFQTLDLNIQARQAELEKLQQFKQAMLLKMFV